MKPIREGAHLSIILKDEQGMETGPRRSICRYFTSKDSESGTTLSPRRILLWWIRDPLYTLWVNVVTLIHYILHFLPYADIWHMSIVTLGVIFAKQMSQIRSKTPTALYSMVRLHLAAHFVIWSIFHLMNCTPTTAQTISLERYSQ